MRESGQGLAEYLIIVVVVAIVVIVGVRYFGSSVSDQIESATGEIGELSKEDGERKAKEGDRPSAKSSSSREGEAAPEVRTASSGIANLGNSASTDSSGTLASSIVEEKAIESIEIDWRFLATIGAVVIAIGIYITFRKTRDKDRDRKKSPKKKKRLALLTKKGSAGESGQAMAEFVIVAITFLFVILGIIQLAMILNAYALVRYAAYNSARAAIVHGGDQEKMQEAARLSLLAIYPRHGRADHRRGLVENYLGAKVTDDNPLFHSYPFTIGGLTYFFSERITEVKLLSGRGRTSGMVVTFDDPLHAEQGVITVEVVHRYEMVIPLVNRILFYVYNATRSKEFGGAGYEGESLNRLAAITDDRRRAGDLYANVEYRIPLVAHYTMRLHSDYVVP